MSLATRIESLVIRVAQEFNDVRATAGSLASLSTNDKSSLVAAINELKAAVLSAMAIDDNQIATTSTYSSNKIVSLLDALKTDILGGADAAYDTLVEIQQALQSGTSGLDAILSCGQSPCPLRCGADPDRGRATAGTYQHWCGRCQRCRQHRYRFRRDL
jgi:hypothetical protein